MSRTRAALPAKSRDESCGAAEHLGQDGAGDVEPLGHRLRHRGVQLVGLCGCLAQLPGEQPGRDDEQRQDDEGEQRDLPGHHEHRGEHEGDAEQVADDVGQGRGERLLGAEDVAVQALDQRAGLGPAEERDRHLLHVVEHGGTQVVDEPFTDPRREPALAQGDRAVGDREQCDDESQPHHDLGMARDDAAVDDRAEEQGGDGAGAGVEGNENEKDGQVAAVRPGKPGDPAQGARGELVMTNRGVLQQRPHRTPAAASPTRKSGNL